MLTLDIHHSPSPDFQLALKTQVPCQGVTAVCGHSGSGKTSLLRLIAGLDRSVNADISLNQRVLQDSQQFVAPERRRIGYVFQDARLFSHLTVEQNIRYGLKRSKTPMDSEQQQALFTVLELSPLLSRRVEKLSGGEQQRVAIARALVANPDLLLMDEPLAAIDATHKAELLTYLQQLFRWLEIPVLYVTHALAEVAQLADQLLVLDHGKLIHHGTPEAWVSAQYSSDEKEQNPAVIWRGTVVGIEPEWQMIQLEIGEANINEINSTGRPRLSLVTDSIADAPLTGSVQRVLIKARDVSISLDTASISVASSIQNRLPMTISQIENQAPYSLLTLQAGDLTLYSMITRKSCHQLQLASGMTVMAQIKATAIIG
ncbi:molybdenum ABC transporter ATP-binding protein [Bacterioplanoides sp. SCSIO 12839]|uniref:molybdenum ABC transporter ATP-binding protein n=1 Tax=Bacterioplanoides sp. SCSIO 12839 TaxID=2829569 RepID=UPI0021030009|nr:molybdenum ABC transporter ATP-binding protein [Bacterioplanoides sp. SCSIO 12839]UTW49986.1 molybdenum ABC transporter ATP-binding protein [Bacterioplanoides sp. SCSIO 12839]